jgi:hypothetical protein
VVYLQPALKKAKGLTQDISIQIQNIPGNILPDYTMLVPLHSLKIGQQNKLQVL